MSDFTLQLNLATIADHAFVQKVYAIRSRRAGLVKIGITNNLVNRFKNMQAQSAEPLEIALVLHGYRELEQELHDRYADWRAHFEWFDEHVLDDLAANVPHIYVTPIGWYRHQAGLVFDPDLTTPERLGV